MDQHKPLQCPKCHNDLAFIEYGQKLGANGKMAKWPVYEKCKNNECPTGRKNLGILDEPELPEYEPLPERAPGTPTKLFQYPPVNKYEQVYYVMLACWKLCEKTMKDQGIVGTSIIFMHETDLEEFYQRYEEVADNEDGSVTMPHLGNNPDLIIQAKDIKVTKKFKYFIIEMVPEVADEKQG